MRNFWNRRRGGVLHHLEKGEGKLSPSRNTDGTTYLLFHIHHDESKTLI